MKQRIQEILEEHFPCNKGMAELVADDIANLFREYKNEFELRLRAVVSDCSGRGGFEGAGEL